MERDEAKQLEEKLRRASFTFEDFLSQLQAVRRMGPLDQLMGMIPGGDKAAKNMQLDDGAFTQVEAIIHSMTRQERVQPKILNGSRRKRIARGSGTTVQDVNQLVKQFQMMQKMIRQMGRAKGGRSKTRMPLWARHPSPRRIALVKLRLKRIGKSKQPYYRIVAAHISVAANGRSLAEMASTTPCTPASQSTQSGP